MIAYVSADLAGFPSLIRLLSKLTEAEADNTFVRR